MGGGKMFLDDMNLGDLNRLRASLDTVAAAMFKLSDGGLKPRLSMLPGDEALIILTNLLPGESEIGAMDPEPSPLRAQIDRVQAENEGVVFDEELDWHTRQAVAEMAAADAARPPGPQPAPFSFRAQIDRAKAKRGIAPDQPLHAGADFAVYGSTTVTTVFEVQDGTLTIVTEYDDPGMVVIEDAIPPGLPVEAAEKAVTLPQAPVAVDVGPKLPEAANLPAAAAPVAGNAAPSGASSLPGLSDLWTDVEEGGLIDVTVRQMLDGAPKSRAIAFAATEIGRSEKSASSRLYNKLKARFADALADATAKKLHTAKGEQTGIRAGAPAEPAAGEGVAAPASPAAPQAAAPRAAPHAAQNIDNPLRAHLSGLPTKGGWTRARDLELLDLSVAGWQVPEIAMEMAISSADIKARFALLLGTYRDANDKEQRWFKRDDVQAGLKALAAKADAA